MDGLRHDSLNGGEWRHQPALSLKYTMRQNSKVGSEPAFPAFSASESERALTGGKILAISFTNS